MFDSLNPLTPSNLQLGEGVLLRGVDLDAVLRQEDPAAAMAGMVQDPQKLIGAVKDGCVFRCVPDMLYPTARGKRPPAAGETLCGSWTVTLSGTLIELSPSSASLLLNVPLYTIVHNHTTVAPKPTPVPAAKSSLCWVGAVGTRTAVIELQNPIATSGLMLKTRRGGTGEMPFAFMAQKSDPAAAALPCRIVWLTGGEAA